MSDSPRRARGLALCILLLLSLPGAARAAEPVTAESALKVYRETFLPVRSLDCPPVVGDEIVVCGRPDDAPDPNRLPLPIQREPGEVVRHVGEMSTIDQGPCRRCTQPVGISLTISLGGKKAPGGKAELRPGSR